MVDWFGIPLGIVTQIPPAPGVWGAGGGFMLCLPRGIRKEIINPVPFGTYWEVNLMTQILEFFMNLQTTNDKNIALFMVI
jgi:hypothetical protein